MSVINYPSSLPAPEINGYGYQQKPNVLKSAMDGGNRRHRVLHKNSRTVLKVTWQLTTAQLDIQETFEQDEIEDGALWFCMNIKTPNGLAVHDVRYVPGTKNTTLTTNNLWAVSVSIEVKDRTILSEEQTADAVMNPNTAEQFITGVDGALDDYLPE